MNILSIPLNKAFELTMAFPRISKYSLDCVVTISARRGGKGQFSILLVGLKVDYAEDVKVASKSKERIIIKEVLGGR
jgi:hypothetical protein